MASQSHPPSADSARPRTRIVPAPPPTDPSIPQSIFSVEVSENAEVCWRWLELPDGNRVAIDCDIIECSFERSFEQSADLPLT